MGRRRIERTAEEIIELKRAKESRNVERRRVSRQRNLERRIPILNSNDVDEHYIGEMNVICQYCSAKHFKSEEPSNKKKSFNDCCSHGECALDPLPDPPKIINDLFTGVHQYSDDFRLRIRHYNNIFALASFNANLIQFPSNNRPGPYCFKIQGQIYYQINTSLYPTENETPSYGQLFIVDPDEAVSIRCAGVPGVCNELNKEIVTEVGNTLRECNIFAQSYTMMHEELIQSMINNQEQAEPEMHLLFSLRPNMDPRRYNYQRVNEVAAIFSTNADGDIPESYVTIRNQQTKKLEYLSSMNPHVEPMIYPLFYPFGTRGWQDKISCVNKNKRVSRAAYIKYRMATRDNNIFLYGGKLFQQWIVDNYVKVEKDRMNFCRINQKKIRAESYQGLIDHLQQVADNAKKRVGRMIILPSTFTGSPRNMLQHYQDAMAIVRKFGKPDLFITMTCNPKWREIIENLLPFQIPSDRPDIVSRVFDIKKNILIDTILKEKLFGDVLAYVYVVEYQKRGLPHVHILLTLKQNAKITTPEAVNKYICAEIPDKNIDEKLYNIVMKNMIHGPCGDWCKNEKGKCSKHFPKSFQSETTMDESGYPTYIRRNTGVYECSNGNTTDNQFVVPYNPVLLKKFNCHINVEVVSSIKAIKYLYKYIYKGHDAATAQITNVNNNCEDFDKPIDHDEIKNHIDTRYVSPVEACDRIYGRPLQTKSHSITRLPVHLPNQQSVTISDEASEESIRASMDKQTMLMDYFSLNARDPSARNFTYAEIPSHYVFKKRTGATSLSWEIRKQQFNVIGRMYSISPSQIELFHLRLLLITVKGATSFESIRTVDGIIYDTFHGACLALGLIENDAEWDRAMTEGEVWMMPRQLRNLFVRILIYCHPNDPRELWEKFKDSMSQDFQRNNTLAQSLAKAYNEINILLCREKSDLNNFPTMPLLNEFEDIIDNQLYDELLPKDHEQIGRAQYNKLNEKQRIIVDKILHILLGNEEKKINNCFYIDGPGGSGKTFVYTTLYHLLRGNGKKICTMAFTGIAAILLPEGKTVHRTFGLPVPLFANSTSSIKIGSKDANELKDADMLLWDEGPMAPRYCLECGDRLLRDITNIDSPFGGKIMLIGGDFRQLLPVKVNGTRSEIVDLSIKNSNLWKYFTVFSLTENMRTLPNEVEFAEYLLQIGNGILNDNDNNLLLPDKCLASRDEDIVNTIFKDLIDEKKYSDLSKVAVLSARNADVDQINSRVIELLDKESEKIYTSVDSTENCDNGDIDDVILPEYLNSLNPPNFPPYELKLRNNCIVMLLRNLSTNEGLCNGTRLQILHLSNNLLKCRILTGDQEGNIVFIHRITLYCENIYPFTFKRRQFPIKIAFAMTINKSQGQTFNRIGVDLRKNVFNHGQLYVAFSRVRSWESLIVFLGEQRVNNVVKNYVYNELFER